MTSASRYDPNLLIGDREILGRRADLFVADIAANHDDDSTGRSD